jgi:Hypoxia induced protein conserved region
MTGVFILLAGLLAFGAAISLIRGLVAFLKAAEIDLKNPTIGVSASSLQQNKMMRNRLLYQGAAVFAIVILLSMAGN